MPLIAISGGGTGGHIYPAIGIAKELAQLDPAIKIVFIGGKGRLESRIVPQHGFRFLPISVAGFPRKLTWRWMPVIGKVCFGLAGALLLLAKLKPGIVVGTGGYVCGPVLFAAVLLRIPTVIQEQNASPGLTNRILGRWAKAIYLAFETAASHFPAKKIKVTGNPIRRTIGAVKRDLATYEKFGLDPNLKTVFVMGGSQGALAINQIVMDALDDLAPFHHQIQVIHQTGGTDDYKAVRARYSASSLRHLVQPYFDPIEEVYPIADLMVCRAGGMTIAEITACGIPAIFIPLPIAAGDHQSLNAQAVAEAGGGTVLNQRTLTGRELAAEIVQIITDPERHRRMADASHQFGRPNAGKAIAKSIYSLMRRQAE
ncbi:MAG: undecaprenyldiphospho-muramoylpentapeptide beta-N-acetylglucosaminyltransferase [Candidatus Poribacteria bacterium]|nr:undecaprenyldiphospho-muramoylpentapeptide beta-N-acetylglucosaminyltransferase [Candidatus Poribacteria bacterium]